MALVNDQVNALLQSFMNSLPFQVEHGTASTPDDVRQSMIYETTQTCANSFNPSVDCPNGVPTSDIEAAVATYQAALQSQVNMTAGQFAAGTIVNPVGLTPQSVAAAVGLYYSPNSGAAAPSNIMPPEASPTSPAFTSPPNVAATAPVTQVTGTSAGIGPSQGGSTTQQSNLNPAPGSGPEVAALAPNNHTALYLILAGVFILVLLMRKG